MLSGRREGESEGLSRYTVAANYVRHCRSPQMPWDNPLPYHITIGYYVINKSLGVAQ